VCTKSEGVVCVTFDCYSVETAQITNRGAILFSLFLIVTIIVIDQISFRSSLVTVPKMGDETASAEAEERERRNLSLSR
jgi:hypothetical protein